MITLESIPVQVTLIEVDVMALAVTELGASSGPAVNDSSFVTVTSVWKVD